MVLAELDLHKLSLFHVISQRAGAHSAHLSASLHSPSLTQHLMSGILYVHSLMMQHGQWVQKMSMKSS